MGEEQALESLCQNVDPGDPASVKKFVFGLCEAFGWHEKPVLSRKEIIDFYRNTKKAVANYKRPEFEDKEGFRDALLQAHELIEMQAMFYFLGDLALSTDEKKKREIFFTHLSGKIRKARETAILALAEVGLINVKDHEPLPFSAGKIARYYRALARAAEHYSRPEFPNKDELKRNISRMVEVTEAQAETYLSQKSWFSILSRYTTMSRQKTLKKLEKHDLL